MSETAFFDFRAVSATLPELRIETPSGAVLKIPPDRLERGPDGAYTFRLAARMGGRYTYRFASAEGAFDVELTPWPES